MAEDAEAAAVRLLELARGERGADCAELLAELRAEHRQVRLHVELRRLDIAELDLLDAQLLAQLVDVPGCERRALDDEPAERLPRLQLRGRASLVAEPDDPAHLGDLGEQVVVRGRSLRPAGEVHRIRRVAGGLADEHLPEMLAQERHHRRDDAQRLHERQPEHVQGDGVPLPEAPA